MVPTSEALTYMGHSIGAATTPSSHKGPLTLKGNTTFSSPVNGLTTHRGLSSTQDEAVSAFRSCETRVEVLEQTLPVVQPCPVSWARRVCDTAISQKPGPGGGGLKE